MEGLTPSTVTVDELAIIQPADGKCTDCDEDCLDMIPDEIRACAALAPETGYCPFMD